MTGGTEDGLALLFPKKLSAPLPTPDTGRFLGSCKTTQKAVQVPFTQFPAVAAGALSWGPQRRSLSETGSLRSLLELQEFGVPAVVPVSVFL